MPLRLEVKKFLSCSSDRVKCVDVHPTEPWIAVALYSGHVYIWNHSNSTLVKSIEICELPVRAVKFVPRKQWLICASDDTQVRVYNYNTTERVKMFEAHMDYVRCLAVHPTLPLMLTSSDDMSIKMWNWEQNWACVQTFEGHSHYVMQVEFNPKDPNTFASASLDRSIKVWGINSATAHFSLEGHERGVNCVSYFGGGDKPFIVSGADDSTVKVWDYQTKACVATLEGHTNNVSSVLYHPTLPIIISGSEDGTVRIWHSSTFRLENTLNYAMERVWSLGFLANSNKLAIGYDEGTVMVKLGLDEPVISMDNTGKVVFAKNHEFNTAHVKQSLSGDSEIADGERMLLATKDAGSCEIFPQFMEHSPNGRLLTVCGDGEFIIYTALALKNKSFGQALDFVWAQDNGCYATRESSSRIKVFKDFKEHKSFRPQFTAEGIFGGALLAVRSSEFVDFYDWDELRLVRRIAVCPRRIMWSDNGELLVIACESSFYMLRYRRELAQKYFDQGTPIPDQGIEDAFDVEAEEVSEKIRTGKFIGDCFLYNTSAGRLNYMVGGQSMTLAHLDRPMYLIGYLQKENRIYLCDKQYQVVSYQLLLSVLVYQTAIVRRELDMAEKTLSTIPKEFHNKLAHFLEGQDLKDLALNVSCDPEHKFELACQLHQLSTAHSVLLQSAAEHGAAGEQKWRQLGDLALAEFNLELAVDCFKNCDDLAALLMIFTSQGNTAGMCWLAKRAGSLGRYNIAFTCYLLTQNLDMCIQTLIDSNRIPEAAFFARTYKPSLIPTVVDKWREHLRPINERAAKSLADPQDYPDAFTDLDYALQVESFLAKKKSARVAKRIASVKATAENADDDVTNTILAAALPAFGYAEIKGQNLRKLIDEAKSGDLLNEDENETQEEELGNDEFEDAQDSHDEVTASQVEAPKFEQVHVSETPKKEAPSVTSSSAVKVDAPYSAVKVAEPIIKPTPMKESASESLSFSSKESAIKATPVKEPVPVVLPASSKKIEEEFDLEEVDALVDGSEVELNDEDLDLDNL